MSATRLLVLGVVRMYGKAHGYQVRRELLSWAADKWGNVQPGSIYHALKKMTAEGLLEQVEDTEAGGGPDRVAYTLTEDGETEFLVQLGRALSSDDATGYTLSAAVTFMPSLPRPQVLALLKQQLANMEAHAQSTHYAREHSIDLGKPPHVSELYRLWSSHAEANVSWMRDLIGRLEAGEYVMSGEGEDEAAFGEPPK
ncbi:PadR family transcriptional regulator [Amycolatopsis sp. NPDC051071]|uniref:PadR family transcriptional regulator n=1 Tax=Amycolatopsis sp. NPDC051071 TaxID=3154637 RepID=UPI00342010BA